MELREKSTKSFAMGARGLIGAAKMMPTSFETEFLENLGGRIYDELKSEGGVNRAYAVWGQRPL